MLYTAAVLNENSGHLLRWLTKASTDLEERGFRFQTPQGDPLPHHMTLNLGPFDKKINDASVLGGFAELHIDRIKFCHKLGVCAAPVISARVEVPDGQWGVTNSTEWRELKTFNDHPHITTCLKPGVGAKFSNDMLASPEAEEIVFDRTYILDGWIKEVKPQKFYTGK